MFENISFGGKIAHIGYSELSCDLGCTRIEFLTMAQLKNLTAHLTEMAVPTSVLTQNQFIFFRT